MDYIIGVDGGGTKTEAVAYNLEDNKIASSVAGPGNVAVDFDGTESNIKEAISQCFLSIKAQGIIGQCQGIYLGVAGIEVGNNKKRLESAIGDTFRCSVMGYHDSELTFAALLQGRDGIIIISGTGSVSYGRYRGKIGKTGGWGHVLGDEGSGYWIALEALKRMTLEQDSGLNTSLLSQRIMTYLGVSSVDAMKEFVHGAGKYEIAKLAVVVADVARTGEPNASGILDCAGQELALMTLRLYKKLNLTGPVTVGISGGILRNIDQVRQHFCACLKKDMGAVNILLEDVNSTKGACYLHRQRSGKDKWNL